jgi:hypothetical protein
MPSAWLVLVLVRCRFIVAGSGRPRPLPPDLGRLRLAAHVTAGGCPSGTAKPAVASPLSAAAAKLRLPDDIGRSILRGGVPKNAPRPSLLKVS